MKEKIEAMLSKINLLRSLPQNEYTTVGDHLLPFAIDIKNAMAEFCQKTQREWEGNYWDTIAKAASLGDEGKSVFISTDNIQYKVTVTTVSNEKEN